MVQFEHSFSFWEITSLCLFVSGLIWLMYNERRILTYKLGWGDSKSIILAQMNMIILRNKNNGDYNPYFLLKKYFDGNQNIPKHHIKDAWDNSKNFWLRVFSSYPNEFISKLETDIIISNEVNYFEKLIYSNTEYLSISDKERICRILIKQGKIWSRTYRKNQQALRLGYFLLEAGFIIPEKDTQKSCLLALNKAYDLNEDESLAAAILIKNPLDNGSNRTEKGIDKAMKEIEEFFNQIKWSDGIKMINHLKTN